MDSEISAQPMQGVVLCCTSIPVDLRTDIAKKVTELGGVYKNDLTHEVTHLVVGDYNTPKYRHVAYERPDIKPVCVGWVDAVLDLWTQDAPIDLPALEQEWKLRTFEAHGGLPAGPDGQPVERGRLLCSMTGFEEEERQRIIAAIVDNGGVYSGDLTREVTHLIVHKPDGKKYNAAVRWGIRTVSVEWLHDCVARGMILDEAKYDPRLPPEARGQGACLVRTAAERAAVLGKRQREAATATASTTVSQQGLRKLRKTASRKLAVQRDSLWDDILGKSVEAEGGASEETAKTPDDEERPRTAESQLAKLAQLVKQTAEQATQKAQPPQEPQKMQPQALPTPQQQPPSDMLATSLFYIHGFSSSRTHVLVNAVATMGGTVATSLTDMAALAAHRRAASGSVHVLQHVIVPQEAPAASLPTVPDDVVLVTEFFIEKCLHKNQYIVPSGVRSRSPGGTAKQALPEADASVIGRPFPVFPIPGFDALTVCTAGFTGVDLHQVDKTVRQLGAQYQERFTAQCSLLVVTALPAVRKQKLELALSWKVPVVDAKWLWACIASGTRQPVDAYLFPQLRQADIVSEKLPPPPPASEPESALTVPTLVMSPGILLPGQSQERPPEKPQEPPPVRDSSTAPDEKQPTPQPEPRKPLDRVRSEVADSATGDSDSDNDIEAAIKGAQNSRQEQPQPHPPRAAIRRSATAAVAAVAPTARQHPMLSRVASDGPAGLQHAPAHPIKPIGVSIDELMRDGGITGGGNARHRAGLSRSASAASMAASASASVSAAVDSLATGGEPPNLPPTQTQVQYLDPEADMYRARLMQKILGVSAAEADTNSSSNGDDDQGKGVAAAVAMLGESAESSRPIRRSSRLR